MGMMQRMRSLSPLLVGAFIVVFLLLMVLGDIDLSSIFGNRGTLTPTTVLGEVEGQSITNKEFSERVNETIEQQRQQNAQQGKEEDIDENTIREQVWSQMVDEILIRKQAEKAGVSVTNDEILDVMLDNPPDFLKKSFIDSTGTFRRELYLKLVTNPEALRDNIPDNSGVNEDEEVAKWKRQLVQIEKYLLQQKMQENMTSVFGAASIASPVQVRRQFDIDNNSAAMNFVFIDANKIKDSEVKVDDAEVQAYYDKNKSYFKQKETRKIKYMVFPFAPSSNDSMKSANAVGILSKALATAVTPEQRDSVYTLYSAQYSGKTYDYTSTNAIDPSRLGVLSNMTEGQIVGPIPSGASTLFIRYDGKRAGSDTLVRASHILISFGPNKDSSKAIANATLARVRGGEDFGKVAAEKSDDKGSAQRGGDVSFFGRAAKASGNAPKMVPEFENASFNTAVGQITGLVETQYGYHIIKVTDKQMNEIKFSEIAINNEMSSSTRKDLAMKAASVKEKVSDGMTFDSVGTMYKQRFSETPFFEHNSPQLGSIDITMFAFNNPVGTVSKPFEMRFGYVVIQVTDKRDKGIRQLADMKEEIVSKLMRIKKLDATKAKAESIASKLMSSGSLDGVKSIDTSLEMRSVAAVKDNGQLQGIPNSDHVLTAQVMKLEQGKISSALRGERGYYIVQLTGKTMADNNKFSLEAPAITTKLVGSMKQSGFFQWYQSVRENANIEDNRYKYYGTNN